MEVFFSTWIEAFWATLRETGPFLLLGFFLAGVLHIFVSGRVVFWALGQSGWRGALRGALVGAPLPLCSCGVLPTAMALRRQGASLSSTASFTISTPETSIDALAITAALLPTVFLGVRPLSALILAMGVGIVAEKVSRKSRGSLKHNLMRFSKAPAGTVSVRTEATGCFGGPGCGCGPAETAEICKVCGLMTADEESHTHGLLAKTRAIFQYAFGSFFADIATWLIIGLAIAALLQVALPASAFSESSWLGRAPILQILLAIVVGIPLYSCATATTPLVAVLLAKGMDPGAALVFLLAAPATNVANVFALKRELGARTTAAYYGALAAVCLVIGLVFHYLWPLVERFPALTRTGAFGEMGWASGGMPEWLEIGSALLVAVLALRVWGKAVLSRLNGKGHAASHAPGQHSH